MAKKERGLGRGLDALFSVENNVPELQTDEIDIKMIRPRENQPRKSFDPALLQELADSIAEHGVLQPVLLRPSGKGYEIVAGERRWRAAGMAGLDKIPALIRELEDVEVAEISLIENLQRDDLSATEEALAYRNLIDEYRYTQDDLAKRIGKSRTHITNTMRLLTLPAEVLDMIDKRQISTSHARALLGLKTKQEQIKAAQDIAKRKISVRQTEEIVRFEKESAPAQKAKEPELMDLEERLQRHFGSRAEIRRKKQGGTLEITFFNEEDLERILELIGLH